MNVDYYDDDTPEAEFFSPFRGAGRALVVIDAVPLCQPATAWQEALADAFESLERASPKLRRLARVWRERQQIEGSTPVALKGGQSSRRL